MIGLGLFYIFVLVFIFFIEGNLHLSFLSLLSHCLYAEIRDSISTWPQFCLVDSGADTYNM